MENKHQGNLVRQKPHNPLKQRKFYVIILLAFHADTPLIAAGVYIHFLCEDLRAAYIPVRINAFTLLFFMKGKNENCSIYRFIKVIEKRNVSDICHKCK